VIPKPPFACDLTLEDEIQAFERLKPRLRELWSAVFPGDEAAYTSVVVPSLTLDQGELQKLPGAAYYEERLLFLMIRLRNPQARLVYVTSVPIHPLVVEYYLQLLVGIPASHARARLTLLAAYDHSPRPLTQKILERPRLIQRIRAAVSDRARAYLTVFNSTPLERRLSVLLGIPMNGLDPALSDLGTKSGSRRVFREAGIEHPLGAEDLHSPQEVEEALFDLRQRRPGLGGAVLKLDDSFSGEGNAVFRFPDRCTRSGIRQALGSLELSVAAETVSSYLDRFERMGGVVEEYLTASEVTSPSVQLRVNAHGAPHISSTHEQILGGRTGQVYLGCRFPARDEYRNALHEAGLRIGQVLAGKGVVSRLSVDFLARRLSPESPWDLKALEINLRMGGTTHPMLALRFLTGGALDLDTGLFRAPSGHTKYYTASDNLLSEAYVGLLPEDLIDILTINKLAFNHSSETGVLFHMIGAISQYGRVGLIAIGNSASEAEQLYARTAEILDDETRYGRIASTAACAGLE
jgi:hypothetical protein